MTVVCSGSGTATFADGTGNAASFHYPYGLAVSVDGTLLFVMDTGNHRIRQVVIATGVVTTLAGSGTATFADGMGNAASFNYPNGVVVSPDGTVVIVADTGNDRIRQVAIADGEVTTLAGTGASAHADSTRGHSATFPNPARVLVSPTGTTIFVGDRHTIRQMVQAQPS